MIVNVASESRVRSSSNGPKTTAVEARSVRLQTGLTVRPLLLTHHTAVALSLRSTNRRMASAASSTVAASSR